jgi:hypothetical protein
MDSTLTLILRLLAASDTSKPATLRVSEWHVLLVQPRHHPSSLGYPDSGMKDLYMILFCGSMCNLVKQSASMDVSEVCQCLCHAEAPAVLASKITCDYGYKLKRASAAHRLKTTYAALMRARRKMIHHTDGMVAMSGCFRGHQYRSYVAGTRGI